MKWSKKYTSLLATMSLVVLLIACNLEGASADDHMQNELTQGHECFEECGANSECQHGICECNEGFYRELGGEDCIVSICSQQCGPKEKCVKSKCICIEGYENFGHGGIVNCSEIVVKPLTKCTETCGQNAYCKEDKCECMEGFHQALGSEECVESVCNPQCGINEICVKSNCVCKEGFENFGSGGVVNCSVPSIGNELEAPQSLAEPSLPVILNSTHFHNTTTTPSHITTTTPSHNTTTTPSHNTTTTHTTQHTKNTHNTTTTITPKPKTTKHPHHKAGMSPWAITGLIVLVACIVGFTGFMIYRHKQRGSYRATTTIPC